MNLTVCGLSHKTAPLPIREKIAIKQDEKAELLLSLLARADISQAVILSTCNRTEIYTDAKNTESVIEVLLKHADISADVLASCLYEYHGFSAVEHIMSVACGLDSMVMGEPQILGQMKEAVAFSNEYQALDHRFHTLFQRVFALAKHVRTTTEIGVCPVSIASIAVSLVKKELGDFTDKKALLIGASDTNRLALNYLRQQGLQDITIASRSLEKAQTIALPVNGKAITLTDIKHHLPHVDMVLSATLSEIPLLGKGLIEQAMKARENRKLILMDLAVPRDIEPEVADLPHILLFSIDDLKDIANLHVESRSHAAIQARKSITKHAEEYMQWLQSLESVEAIRTFRNRVSTLREEELQKAYRLLAQGTAPDIVLERLANRLTNKLMHIPSVHMRQACTEGSKEILEKMQTWFTVKPSKIDEL